MRTPVLMYHEVARHRLPGDRIEMTLTVDEFAAQMEWLHRQRMTPVSVDTLYRHWATGENLPDNTVVLTFDDNYQGFYDHAYPILRRRKFPCALFVHTDYIGSKVGSHPKMDARILRLLAKDPLITIGSHSKSHPARLDLLNKSQQRQELTDSRHTLEKLLGIPIRYLSYPCGRCDITTIRIAASAGYRMAFTADAGSADDSPHLLAINRYPSALFMTAFRECRDPKHPIHKLAADRRAVHTDLRRLAKAHPNMAHDLQTVPTTRQMRPTMPVPTRKI